MLYIALLVTAVLFASVVYRIIAYRRYLRESTQTAVSREFKRSIEKEEAVQRRRVSKFKEVLERARRKLSN